MGNKGHNGYAQKDPVDVKTRTAADMKKRQQQEEAALKGTPALLAALRPGRLVRLTANAHVIMTAGPYNVLGRGNSVEQPGALQKGALLMMVGTDRVTLQGGIRRPYYTFLQMGTMQRCVVQDLSLLEATQ